jgi:predicted TIM-barrel fold metal-dependent hydrolase
MRGSVGNVTEIIDADGHVDDIADQEAIAKYMPPGNRSSQSFPVLDHLHFHFLRPPGNRAGLENPGPQEWVGFLDETGISSSVLYPTFGLAVGRFVSHHWAIAACRAYNTWLYEKFTSKNSRLKGMALLPIQDVDAAVVELRRAVNEFGMLGGMLPSNGEGIKDHLGAKMYWPIYEEAEKLGCALAVHVGSLHHLGMDGFSTYYPVHALGHPFGIAIQAAGLLAHGIFERFSGIRVAFLEGGSTWVPFFLDRLDRSIIPATCKWTSTVNRSADRSRARRRAIICAGKCATGASMSASTSTTMAWASPCKKPDGMRLFWQ